MINAQAETAKAEARYARVKSIIDAKQTDAIVTDVLDSSISNDLRKKYLEASKLETEIEARLGPDHVQAVRLRAEMEEYKRLMSVRARGGIVVVIAHRSGVLAVCDFVLMMQEGRMIAFGPKEEVLARVSRPEAARTPIAERVAQLKVVVDGINAAE